MKAEGSRGKSSVKCWELQPFILKVASFPIEQPNVEQIKQYQEATTAPENNAIRSGRRQSYDEDG
jgi:hypothetical protein